MNNALRGMLGAFLLSMVAPALATIVSGSVSGGTAATAGGSFIKLTVPLANPFGLPNSVGDDTFQSPNLYGFDEDQNIVLAVPLQVDVGTTLAVGTTVASHYVFFDPGPSQSIIGTVSFDAPVLAILTSTNRLSASDFLAKTGVNYLNPGQRGLEVGDSVTISGMRQITFATTASTPGDYVRVLTAFSPLAVPEPGTLPLLAFGMGTLGLLSLRRKLSNR